MAKKSKYNLTTAVVARFFRVWIPQVVLFYPVLAANAERLGEILPFWTLPVLGFVGAVFTALDKLFREIKLYDRVKNRLVSI